MPQRQMQGWLVRFNRLYDRTRRACRTTGCLPLSDPIMVLRDSRDAAEAVIARRTPETEPQFCTLGGCMRRRGHVTVHHFQLPLLGSSRCERSTSGQATSSGVVEGFCGVGLRAKHLFDLNLQAVLISSSSNNAYRMEACSVDQLHVHLFMGGQDHAYATALR